MQKGDVIVSFNWDLSLERALHTRGRSNSISHTFSKDRITLLKPHGSVNWFDSEKIRLKERLTSELIPGKRRIRVFRHFRYPRVDKRIVPIIIPPVTKKEFPYAELDIIWRDTWKVLRRADEIHVIGFSLPPEDLHVRFVMRSAIRTNEAHRSRRLKVTVVNPDRNVFLRFARLVKTPIKYLESTFEGISLRELTGVPRHRSGA